MKSVAQVTCLALLMASFAFAQTTPSTEQQPAANAQVQPDTKTSADTQKDNDKKDDSESGHKLHVRLGGVAVAASYSSAPFFYGPFWPYGFYPYGPYGVGWYSSFFYSPFYSPFYGFYGPYAGGFAYAPDKGEVKLNANPKDARVFLDGAYAGTAEHLKDMWLDSGAYDLSVSSPGKETFRQRIYVISGKKLKIDARLMAQKENAPTEEKR